MSDPALAPDRPAAQPRPGTPWKRLTLSGWGRLSEARSLAARPERVGEVAATLAGRRKGDSILAFGAGRSYGDAALNDGGRALLTARLNRILAFDAPSGEVVVEPGVTFRDLLEVFLPRGLVAPASPGTAFATIGGAVANDVHGKNHEAVGSFGNHIRWLEILLPSGEVVRASPEQRPDLLRLAVGGIGLGGVILAVCLRLMRVPSNALALTERRLGDLEGTMAALAEPRAKAAYSVAWLDALAGGRSLGRGVLEIAEPALKPLVVP